MDRVCHFEVPYSDKSRAEEFYTDVFGWNFSDAPTENPYSFAITTEVDEATWMPTKPGGINGGMYPRGEQGATSPVIVMEVDSCEQRIKDVEAAGGSNLFGPHEIGDMGIYAQVKDTEDNIIGLWQPLRGGKQITRKPGQKKGVEDFCPSTRFVFFDSLNYAC